MSRRVARLDHAVQSEQVVAIGKRRVRFRKRVQDRLVVLVHKHHGAPARFPVQGFQQVCKASRRGQVLGRHAQAPFGGGELLHHVRFEHSPLRETAAAEVEPHYGVAFRPVPAIVDMEPGELRLVALEQLLDGVQEQALTEPAGTRQEVVLAAVDQSRDVIGLVHVVAVALHAPRERSACRSGSLRLVTGSSYRIATCRKIAARADEHLLIDQIGLGRAVRAAEPGVEPPAPPCTL